MILRDIAPDFRYIRCGNDTYVEIPSTYGKYMPPRLPRDLRYVVNVAILAMSMKWGQHHQIHDESGTRKVSSHECPTRNRWLIPARKWDRIMAARVKGWEWIDGQAESE